MSAAIFVIILTTLFCYYDSRKKNSNKGLIFSAIIVTVFGGLRYGYGSDYPSYFRLFQTLSTYELADSFSDIRTELGWNLLNVLCNSIGFFGMVIVLTTFETIVVYRFIGRYVNPKYYWLANICYTFNTNMMLLGFSMMRQFLAMCIFLIAVDFIVKKKWIIAILITIFAGLFHYSAFILIPFCFVGYIGEKEKNTFWLQTLFFFILGFYFFGGPLFEIIMPDLFSIDVFEDYGDVYGNDKIENVSMFSIARIYEALLFICLMLNYLKLNTKEKDLSLLYSMSVLLGGLVSVNAMAGRIILYFSIIGVAVIPYIVQYFKDNLLKISFVLVYFIFLLYRFVVFFNTPIWESFKQYHTIFEHSWQ